jgi:hypothetical protein
MKKQLGLFIALGLAAASAQASTTINTQPGVPHQTPALSGFQTFGDQMDGMGVSVWFSDGTLKSASWQDSGPGAGEATVADWFKLSESGDTFGGLWTLQNLSISPAGALGPSIVGFSLWGPSGDVVFDKAQPDQGTPGSARGWDFDMQGAYDVTALYYDIVNLTGSPAEGDLYAALRVSFSANTPLLSGGSAQFIQDTDSAATKGSITPVPEAATTLALLGLGLLGTAAMRKRIA